MSRLGANPTENTKAKMRHFADLYLGGPDEVRSDAAACYRALYPKSAHHSSRGHGSEYLNHPYTQAYIKEKMEAMTEECDITVKYILTTITDTIERCRQAKPVLDRKGDPVLVETEDGEMKPAYTFDANNVLRGADMLAKYKGMYAEKVELTGKDGGPIEMKDISDNELARRVAFMLTKAAKSSERS
ncbi:hypothetical protein RE428_31900 [Marinobacter nanhaiticus D15-8W]|uniref:Terminase small subunit n=1 Tax=Marinobacter nanhaiticus D15-8W TaxID=626887 RepID=N6W9I6_9GAMM|nr:hypothetical protein [Marinobacter nanhaiticus]ENO16949.1 hypothetical protein J057_01720 [Marinobacter nanhaiticus D15-8W]BES72172.1 hypothetical protein RE428_31900 [Marinobacter nanhaiticus D15-8W]